VNKFETYQVIDASKEDFQPAPSWFAENTFLISDTHFFHVNIGRYCQRPENWQELIVQNWKRLVKPEDIVLHLGDVALGKKSDWENLGKSLTGVKYLLRGNHDRGGSVGTLFGFAHAFSEQFLCFLLGHRKIILSHRPLKVLNPNGAVNFHGHIHNNPCEFENDGIHFNLSVEVLGYCPVRLGEFLREHRI